MAARYTLYLDKIINEETAQTVTSGQVGLDNYRGYAVYLSWTDSSPSNSSFVDGDVTVGADTVDETGHGFLTGLKGQLTTTGTLPAGLSLSTDYWIIKVDNDTYKFASSLANAQAGTAVDITAAAGGGTHTFTPTALAGTAQLLGSADGTNFNVIDGTEITVNNTNSNLYNVTDAYYRYTKAQIEITAGQITVLCNLSAKGH
jgi:hypothetical protein